MVSSAVLTAGLLCGNVRCWRAARAAILRGPTQHGKQIPLVRAATPRSRGSSDNQLGVRASDRLKTSVRSQLGQVEWSVVPFGLQGSPPPPMRVVKQALTVGCMGESSVRSPPPWRRTVRTSRRCSTYSAGGKPFAKGPKCELGRRKRGFSGRRLSRAGVPAGQCKAQSIVGWARLAPCAEVRRCTGRTDFCRRAVEGCTGCLRGAADGAGQPHGAVRAVACGAGERRRAQGGPLVGASAPPVGPGPAGGADG